MLSYLLLLPLVPFVLLFLFLYYQELKAKSVIYNTKDGSHPYCLSIFYTFYFLLFGKKDETLVHYETRHSKDKGDLILAFQFFQPCVYVRSAEFATYVLKNPKIFEKIVPPFSREVKEFVGKKQIAMANGHEWQKQRKVLDPAFMDLKVYQKIFEQKSKLVIGRIKEGVCDNVTTIIQKMALDVLGLTIFGYDFNSISGNIEKNIEAYTTLMEIMNAPSKIFYYFIKEQLLPWTTNPDITKALDTFHSLIDNCIADSKKKTHTKDVSMLDMMIASQSLEDGGLTDEEIRDNCKVFFIAGQETTANAISFGLFHFAEYPDIQEEIRKDIQAIYKNGELSYEDLKNLESLNFFVKENMRMFPPGAVIPMKMCSEDTKIGDYFIPKGFMVSVQIHAIHHSKEIYGDPEVFRPSRWKKEESKKYPFGSYLPFSLGPRICIGNDFSTMEQKNLLAHILLNYKISKVNPKDYPHADSSSTVMQNAANYPLKFDKI